MIRTLLHNIFHKHVTAGKFGMGQFMFCRLYLVSNRGKVYYQPGFSGAGWHEVPLPDDDQIEGSLFQRMLTCDSSEQAMALLRQESSR